MCTRWSWLKRNFNFQGQDRLRYRWEWGCFWPAGIEPWWVGEEKCFVKTIEILKSGRFSYNFRPKSYRFTFFSINCFKFTQGLFVSLAAALRFRISVVLSWGKDGFMVPITEEGQITYQGYTWRTRHNPSWYIYFMPALPCWFVCTVRWSSCYYQYGQCAWFLFGTRWQRWCRRRRAYKKIKIQVHRRRRKPLHHRRRPLPLGEAKRDFVQRRLFE